jgi:hypothetical protein
LQLQRPQAAAAMRRNESRHDDVNGGEDCSYVSARAAARRTKLLMRR